METGSKTEVQSKSRSKPNTKRPKRKCNISNTNEAKGIAKYGLTEYKVGPC